MKATKPTGDSHATPCTHSNRTDPQHCGECGATLCGARKKNCGCGHHFSASERELANCPECGTLRFCRQQHVYPGNGRCRVHGGKTVSGPLHHSWVSGRYARYWRKAGRGDDYEQLSKDDLMDAAIGLANLQLQQLNLLEQGVPTARTLHRIRSAFVRLTRADDDSTREELTKQLAAVIEEGARAVERWEEFCRLEEQMDKKRGFIERRAINARLLISTEYVRGLMIKVIFASQTAIREKFRELELPAYEAEALIARVGFELDRSMSAVAFPQDERPN